MPFFKRASPPTQEKSWICPSPVTAITTFAAIEDLWRHVIVTQINRNQSELPDWLPVKIKKSPNFVFSDLLTINGNLMVAAWSADHLYGSQFN